MTVRCPACGYKRLRVAEGTSPLEGVVCARCRQEDRERAEEGSLMDDVVAFIHASPKIEHMTTIRQAQRPRIPGDEVGERYPHMADEQELPF